jgi:hypothetical protein
MKTTREIAAEFGVHVGTNKYEGSVARWITYINYSGYLEGWYFDVYFMEDEKSTNVEIARTTDNRPMIERVLRQIEPDLKFGRIKKEKKVMRKFKCINNHSPSGMESGKTYDGDYTWGSKTWSVEELFDQNSTVSSSLEEILETKIIGYKLKKDCEQYVSALEAISRAFNYEPFQVFLVGSAYYDDFKEANVLDLWFDAVYEESIKLPKMSTYEGDYNEETDQVSYGCKDFDVDTIRNLVTQEVRSINVEGVTVRLNDLKQIIKFIDKN